jgi:hypothetical protein
VQDGIEGRVVGAPAGVVARVDMSREAQSLADARPSLSGVVTTTVLLRVLLASMVRVMVTDSVSGANQVTDWSPQPVTDRVTARKVKVRLWRAGKAVFMRSIPSL